MVRIRRFGVIRTATVAAVMYALAAVVITLVVGLPVVLLRGAVASDNGMVVFGGGVAGVVIFGLLGALAYGIGGWIVTAIACVVYNLAAGWVGGIEVQLENFGSPTPPQWGGPYGPQTMVQPGGYPPPYAPGAGPGQPPMPPGGWGQG